MAWAHKEFKNKANPIVAKRNRWTTILRWDKGEVDLGHSVLEAEIYGIPPDARPQNIETRWVRLNDPLDASDNDVTKRQGHAVGSRPVWAGIAVGLEDIAEHDLPLELRLFQDGGGPMTIHTVVGKVGRLA
jgi:hypothetical protein